MAETSPDRLVAALLAAGWFEAGRTHSGDVIVCYGRPPSRQDIIVVPVDPDWSGFDQMMADALTELRQLADVGLAADRALTEAICSCGGKRWVDDEGWSPPDWAMGVKPVREPGAGLIPCGRCNHGGWNVPAGGGEA